MPEQSLVGARVTQDCQQQIQEIAALAGLMSAQVVISAIAQDLGRTDPSSIKGDHAAESDRVIVLSRQVSLLGEIGGLK